MYATDEVSSTLYNASVSVQHVLCTTDEGRVCATTSSASTQSPGACSPKTVSTPLPPGRWWLGVHCQGGCALLGEAGARGGRALLGETRARGGRALLGEAGARGGRALLGEAGARGGRALLGGARGGCALWVGHWQVQGVVQERASPSTALSAAPASSPSWRREAER
jgi:hypothetical protein